MEGQRDIDDAVARMCKDAGLINRALSNPERLAPHAETIRTLSDHMARLADAMLKARGQ